MTAPRPDLDQQHMRHALDLARKGWGQVSPNPMVGAVVVKDDVVVGEGWHTAYGQPHAEVEALARAGNRARGATMYVTLEPCAHTGQTPPCTEALADAGIARLVAAMRDPNPEAAGGAERLRAAGMEVELGCLEAGARELNAAFAHAFQSDRPWVTLKLAVTLEGAIADLTHTTSRITGPPARRYAHHLRAGHDAVAVGMHTIRTDDPQLTVRDVALPRVAPTRVVFSRSGRLSLTSTLANTLRHGPVIVLAEYIDSGYEHTLNQVGVEVLVATDVAHGLRQLRGRGIRSILVEGGTSLAGSLWNAGLVDRLVLIQAPVVFGRGSLNAFGAAAAARAEDAPRLRMVHRELLGDDVATHYAVRELA